MFSGDSQSGTVGTALSNPFVAIVKDANGNPVGGVNVTFAVASGGGSVSAASGTTGSDGKASTTLTLGTTAGVNAVTATSTGLSGSPVTFSATGLGGAVAAITVTPISATIASGNTQQFTATGSDTYNNSVSVTPTWSVTGGIGTISSSGLLTATAAGTGTVVATSGSASGTASVTVTPGTASSIAMDSGNNQNGTVGTVLPSPLVVIVKDANGNPVSGVSVAFNITAGGGSLSATSAITGSNGKASTTLTLGTTAGTNTVTATSTGLSGSPVTFNATGTAGALSTITVTPNPVTIASGNTQQFTAAGKDAYSNTVSITPTWSIEGTIGTNTINSSGLLTAGTAGLVTVKATSGGVFGTADVTVILFIVQPSPTNSTVVASPTSVSANGVSTSVVTVTLRDSSNNPISLHTVTISSGIHVTVITPSSVLTNASGQAVFTVKSSQTGTATITATDATANVVITNTATITFEVGKWDVMAWDSDVWGS